MNTFINIIKTNLKLFHKYVTNLGYHTEKKMIFIFEMYIYITHIEI